MNLRRLSVALVWLVFPGLAVAGSPLDVTVLFDRVDGLKTGDPVVWEETRIGRVETIRYTPEGRFEVDAEVTEAQRSAVTDRSRFVVSPAPGGAGRVLEMIRLGPGGGLLADGAVVEGSTRSRVLGETLEERLRGVLGGLRDLPGDWVAKLGRELDRLGDELGRAGDRAGEHLRKEVIPDVERKLEELRTWLRERGREDELKPLEEKLKELKRV